MKARQLIQRSMRQIGAVGVGETITAEETQDGLDALNAMLDSWSIQRLLVYHVKPVTFNVAAGVGTYTFGAGGTASSERPPRLQSGFIRHQGVDMPFRVTNDYTEYDQIRLKNLDVTWPAMAYYAASYPVSAITFYPVPSQAATCTVGVWSALARMVADDDVIFPPGYERAIAASLAIELAPEYAKTVPNELAAAQRAAIAAIKRSNVREPVSVTDLSRRGAYNIYSDE